jgi:hypothetical protein
LDMSACSPMTDTWSKIKITIGLDRVVDLIKTLQIDATLCLISAFV